MRKKTEQAKNSQLCGFIRSVKSQGKLLTLKLQRQASTKNHNLPEGEAIHATW